MIIDLNCDNCNRVFGKKERRIREDKSDYCCYACCHYHRRFNERERPSQQMLWKIKNAHVVLQRNGVV